MKSIYLTALLGATLSVVHGAPITKDPTGTDLSLGTSWTGGTAPGNLDIATWTSTSLGGIQTFGGNTSWAGINFTGATADANITGTNQTLSLGASGIALSGSQNLTAQRSANGAANVLNLALTADQTWNIASGRSFSYAGEGSGSVVSPTATANLGGFTLTKTGAGTASLANANISNGTINISAGTFALNGGANVRVNVANTVTVNVATGSTLSLAANSGTASVYNQVNNLNGGTLFGAGGSAMTIATVNLGTGTTSTINAGTSSANTYSLSSLAGSGNVNFTRTAGSAIFSLTGANTTFSGDIAVNSGTLNLASTGALNFNIGASGVNNRITGTAGLTLDGLFNFNLANAGTNLGDTWNIVSNSTLTETYNSTFAVGGFTDNGDNTWSHVTGSGITYVFSEGTGALSVTAVPEPSMALLGGIGLLALLRRRR